MKPATIIETLDDARRVRPGDSYIIKLPVDPEEAVSPESVEFAEEVDRIIKECALAPAYTREELEGMIEKEVVQIARLFGIRASVKDSKPATIQKILDKQRS